MKELLIKLAVLLFTFYILHSTFYISIAHAIVDPLSVSNNRFGIHIIQAAPDESSPAASLVNSSGGDWGYITFLIESKDRNHGKWQEFFNDLRRKHLIPLVRLATQPEGNFWKLPYEEEEQAWADFLDDLNWPVKNRYVIIYNEPNHAAEWGNNVDAKSYAIVLDKTITALKKKNSDFFVLNAGFDASAPSKFPMFEDQALFMRQMDDTIPGIFDKLDGWVSHSYPNPGFIGSPDAEGRGTVRTYFWEIQKLSELGVRKNLPIFITETGWKHAEGLSYNSGLPNADTVKQYYQNAFENAWNTSKIVAITPFLLNYQEEPFDHFSFRKPAKEKLIEKFLGLENAGSDPEYYPAYQIIQQMPKTAGRPVQEDRAELVKGEIYSSIVAGENYQVSIAVKNTGQSIWNDRDQVKLVPVQGGVNLGINSVVLPKDQKIEPGQQYVFNLNLKAPQGGAYPVSLNLFSEGKQSNGLFAGEKQFDSHPIQFTTTVKSPVILKIVSSLEWKKDFAGDCILKFKGISGENTRNVGLNSAGISNDFEARYLLPDYSFEFSLQKPFYVAKTINQKVYVGINILNFGTLQLDFLSVILHPIKFWQQQPFFK